MKAKWWRVLGEISLLLRECFCVVVPLCFPKQPGNCERGHQAGAQTKNSPGSTNCWTEWNWLCPEPLWPCKRGSCCSAPPGLGCSEMNWILSKLLWCAWIEPKAFQNYWNVKSQIQRFAWRPIIISIVMPFHRSKKLCSFDSRWVKGRVKLNET